jgi:hypothetical protein
MKTPEQPSQFKEPCALAHSKEPPSLKAAHMQSAYWYARRLQPQIQFRHRVVLGHVLLCVSEVSFFFVSALATVAMFDHWKRGQFVLWKLVLLASAIFAFFCYKRQLASVGDALLEAQPEHAEKAIIGPKGRGKP